MSDFAKILYWFPGLSRDSELSVEFSSGRFLERNISPGSFGAVDDVRGLMVCRGLSPGYNPDVQRWDDMGDYWIGVMNDAAPEDFAHDELLSPALAIPLADGNEWWIPIANPLVETCALPAWEKLDAAGNWVKEVKSDFAEISLVAAGFAGRLRESYLRGEDSNIPNSELRGILAKVIALNYDLSLVEMSVLRLFSEEIYWTAFCAFLDWGAMQELLDAERGAADNTANPTAATSGG